MEIRRLTLVDGHVADGPGWVYAWVWPSGIRYVGATWIDPTVRAEQRRDREERDHRDLVQPDAEATGARPDPRAGPAQRWLFSTP